MAHAVVTPLLRASIHHHNGVVGPVHRTFGGHAPCRVWPSRDIKLLIHALVLPVLPLASFLTWSAQAGWDLSILVGGRGCRRRVEAYDWHGGGDLDLGVVDDEVVIVIVRDDVGHHFLRLLFGLIAPTA